MEVVGGRPGLCGEWAAFAGVLGAALEVTQSRERRLGRGRTAAAVDDLVRRTHGSLDHEHILSAVAEVAARANMSPANLYRYFDSKEALIEAVAGRWFQPMLDIMEQVVEGKEQNYAGSVADELGHRGGP